jgi:hypothetical protein
MTNMTGPFALILTQQSAQLCLRILNVSAPSHMLPDCWENLATELSNLPLTRNRR